MAYTALPEIQRRMELARALAASQTSNTGTKSGAITSGLANAINQFRSGRLAKQATEAQSENEKLRTAEMQRLAGALAGQAQPPLRAGVIPNFSTPEVQDLATRYQMDQAMEEAKAKRAAVMNPPSMSLSPQWGIDAEGNYVPMQLSSAGGMVPIETPEGVRMLPSPGLAGFDPSLIAQKGQAQTGVDVSNIQATTDPMAQRAAAIEAATQGAEIAAIAPRSAAESAATRAAERPQREAGLASQQRKYELVSGLIAKAGEGANAWTTGLGAAVLGDIPMTPARDLKATVDTIKANIGASQLQEMRNNSPTGAALGAVSDFENKMLQALLGNLDTSQGPEQFKENLDLVQQQLDSIINGSRAQFNSTYSNQPAGTSQPEIIAPSPVIEVDW